MRARSDARSVVSHRAALKRSLAALLVVVVSSCNPYPWPEAPPGGPFIDGPYKNCLYANGYGDVTAGGTLEQNERALEECEGVPFE